jgi:hypothetical protein
MVADDDARLAAVDALVRLLERKRKRERLRIVVRTKADALDGLSILRRFRSVIAHKCWLVLRARRSLVGFGTRTLHHLTLRRAD